MLRALESMWPLARSSVSENALDGVTEAEIVVPRALDERQRAWQRAKGDRVAELLMLFGLVLLLTTLVSYTRDCRDLFRAQNSSESYSSSTWRTKQPDEL